jgi:hypothetical protein
MCDPWSIEHGVTDGTPTDRVIVEVSCTSSECVLNEQIAFLARQTHTGERRGKFEISRAIYLSGGTSKHIHRHQHHRHAHQSPHRTYPSQRNRSSITRGAVGHSIPLVEGRRALRSAGVEPERLATKAWRGGCRDRSELRTEQNRSISVGCDDAYALFRHTCTCTHAWLNRTR